MSELNIFRLYPNQKANLLNFMAKKGITKTDTINITYQGTNYSLDLYYSKMPQPAKVKWVKELQKHFKLPNALQNPYSGTVLIEINNNSYAVSYGNCHFYISRYCDYEFSIDFAERIIKEFKLKNSREFGGQTRKSVLTYNNAKELSYDGGESVNFIRGIPIDTAIWGKNISCGQSIKLRKRDIDITSAPRLILDIENVIATFPVITNLPRSIRITDLSIINKLRSDLISNIIAKNYMLTLSQQQLVGVDLIFSDKFTYYANVNGTLVEIDEETSLDDISSIISNELVKAEELLDLPVEAQEENGTFAFKKPLIEFIDYIDNKDNYYLEEGKWLQFDTNYLRYLNDAVDKIETDTNPEIQKFDETAYRSWLLTTGNNDKEWYREKYLNDLLEKNYGYKNFDRNFIQYDNSTVEFADLIKDDAFYFVKIGKPQKLNYVIDQSLNALRIIQRNNFCVPLSQKKNAQVKQFVLWIFLANKKKIARVSQLNSLIFQMKLAQWRKEVLLAGLKPIIKLSYK